MASTRIQHEFECTEATFWEVCFFDEEWSRRLYIEELRFPVWRVLEQKATDDFLERRVEVRPLVENVPVSIRKIIGDRFGYLEEGKLDRKQNRYRFRVVPDTMADRTSINGELYTTPVTEGRVRRVVEFSVEVRVPFLGKVVEQKTIDDAKVSYDKMASFTRRYLEEKKLV